MIKDSKQCRQVDHFSDQLLFLYMVAQFMCYLAINTERSYHHIIKGTLIPGSYIFILD